jgi:hypothetical protein
MCVAFQSMGKTLRCEEHYVIISYCNQIKHNLFNKLYKVLCHVLQIQAQQVS